jgi:hypothetical protein
MSVPEALFKNTILINHSLEKLNNSIFNALKAQTLIKTHPNWNNKKSRIEPETLRSSTLQILSQY